MQLAVERSGAAQVARVKGTKLTYPVLASFLAEVHALVGDGARTLVLDLQVVSYIDSAAIGCFVEIHRLLEERGGRLTLSGVHRRVETMLSMTGVRRFLHVEAGGGSADARDQRRDLGAVGLVRLAEVFQ